MLKLTNRTLAGIAAALVVIFVVAAMWYQPAPTVSPAPPMSSAAPGPTGGAILVRPYSPSQGPESAPVTVVEFFDPECESCRAMYPIVKQVMAEFEGRVRLVIRYMPLHPNSIYVASLLEAARAQNKYWEFLEIVMLRQPEWARHDGPRPDLLLTYAPGVGLDVAQLRTAAAGPEIRARIDLDQRDGLSLGANRTPTFFINGQRLARLGHAELRAAVQAEFR